MYIHILYIILYLFYITLYIIYIYYIIYMFVCVYSITFTHHDYQVLRINLQIDTQTCKWLLGATKTILMQCVYTL